MASGCTHEEASFVSLNDLDKISILLGKDNDLEKYITHSFNEVSIFIFKLKKNKKNLTTNQALNTLKTFSSVTILLFSLKVQFSQPIKSQ